MYTIIYFLLIKELLSAMFFSYYRKNDKCHSFGREMDQCKKPLFLQAGSLALFFSHHFYLHHFCSHIDQ